MSNRNWPIAILAIGVPLGVAAWLIYTWATSQTGLPAAATTAVPAASGTAPAAAAAPMPTGPGGAPSGYSGPAGPSGQIVPGPDGEAQALLDQYNITLDSAYGPR